MAKLTIEIDTGKEAKLERGRTSHSGFTIASLIGLVQEASERLGQMGVDADGVVLYGPEGPRGRITLVESDKPTAPSKGTPKGVKIFHPTGTVWYTWRWRQGEGAEHGPFDSAQAALDDSIKVVGVSGCREKVCWCHDPRSRLTGVPEFCSGCGCRL